MSSFLRWFSWPDPYLTELIFYEVPGLKMADLDKYFLNYGINILFVVTYHKFFRDVIHIFSWHNDYFSLTSYIFLRDVIYIFSWRHTYFSWCNDYFFVTSWIFCLIQVWRKQCERRSVFSDRERTVLWIEARTSDAQTRRPERARDGFEIRSVPSKVTHVYMRRRKATPDKNWPF